MVIRKQYKFEGAHIVRNCTSKRCSQNIHGHSYIVEVFITSNRLDDGCMVMDFGRMTPIKQLIDSFDHAFALWNGEEEDTKHFLRKINQRIVEIPLNPSAEGLSLLLLAVIDRILHKMPHVNNEGNIEVASVRIHETATGYAEAFRKDLEMIDFQLKDIHFSDGIKEDWDNKDWWDKLID